MWLKKVSVGYVSGSCDFPKKEKFDGLHKQLKNAFGKNYQKRKLPKKEITKKGNFLKRKLYARKFGKMPEKS